MLGMFSAAETAFVLGVYLIGAVVLVGFAVWVIRKLRKT